MPPTVHQLRRNAATGLNRKSDLTGYRRPVRSSHAESSSGFRQDVPARCTAGEPAFTHVSWRPNARTATRWREAKPRRGGVRASQTLAAWSTTRWRPSFRRDHGRPMAAHTLQCRPNDRTLHRQEPRRATKIGQQVVLGDQRAQSTGRAIPDARIGVFRRRTGGIGAPCRSGARRTPDVEGLRWP